MAKLSVLIPSRNEKFLVQTVSDLLAKARGDIEIIPALDGYDTELPNDPRVRAMRLSKPRGMRAAINAAAAMATGDYLMKCDAHCMFAEGFDEVLKTDCADNWIVIPRRKRLDADNWCLQDVGKPDIDYHYLDCPMTNKEFFQFHGMVWSARALERADKIEYTIDDTMSFQGSLWFMMRKHWDALGGLNEAGYGTFSQEPQEIGNKTWLGGGAIKVNKKTWYAHLHKGKKHGRMYSVDKRAIRAGHEYSARYWMSNQWADRKHDIEWLIEKFMPLPGWSADWQKQLADWRRVNGYA